jgi:hypothetical protein
MSSHQLLPNRRSHEVIAFEHDGQRYVAGVGYYGSGVLAEVFLTASKSGTAIETFATDAAILLSFALQHGADPAAIRRALVRNGNGAPGGPVARLLDILAGEV